MEQARNLQKKNLSLAEGQQPQAGQDVSRPQLIDEELLKQIGGGLREDNGGGAPKGNW